MLYLKPYEPLMLGVTCPYCGKNFEYYGDRQIIFCVGCGKKLLITIQVTGADDSSVSTSANIPESRNTVHTESAGNYGGYFRTSSETSVQIRLPDVPVPTRSRLVCFILKWDGKPIGQFGCGDTVNVVTDSEIHSLEIVQKTNDLFNPLKYWKVFEINPSQTPVIQIGTDGKQFVI